jgi:ABC-type sugar transport system permease subunit
VSAWRRDYGRPAFWFLLPALLLLGLFVVWPMLRSLWWSLHDVDLLATERQRWTGLEQYSDLLFDARFRAAFANTAAFALMVVPVQTLLALLFALWVNRPEPAWRWLRVAFFLPTVMAMPVLAILWTMLYQPVTAGEMGPLNAALVALGLGPRDWLHDPAVALPALAAMSIWQGVGLQMMVFLAALQALPRDVSEAALLDGAGPLQRTLHITLPALRNTIIFVVSVTTIFAFRLFVQPYLMTQDLGRASAGAMLFLLVVGGLTWLARAAAREERA